MKVENAVIPPMEQAMAFFGAPEDGPFVMVNLLKFKDRAVYPEDSGEPARSGSEAYALIKAPWVIVTTDTALKTSARNRLCGTVVRCTAGAVSSEVVIELPGGKLVVAMLTNDSVADLGLHEGVRACALIKASHIILAVPA